MKLKRLCWVILMPWVTLIFPWVGAWVVGRRADAAVIGLIWLLALLAGVFVAFGPAVIALVVLAAYQLSRMPWLPPEANVATTQSAEIHKPPESEAR